MLNGAPYCLSSETSGWCIALHVSHQISALLCYAMCKHAEDYLQNPSCGARLRQRFTYRTLVPIEVVEAGTILFALLATQTPHQSDHLVL